MSTAITARRLLRPLLHARRAFPPPPRFLLPHSRYLSDSAPENASLIPESISATLSSEPAAPAADLTPPPKSSKPKDAFQPRIEFPIHTLPTSYFLGHHKAGLDKIQKLLSMVSLIIECRDFRVPLSSRNPLFEETLGETPRVMVYTKRDLGGDKGGKGAEAEHVIRTWHGPATPVHFITSTNARDITRLYSHLVETGKDVDCLTGTRILVIGMPNVGKSTLLNALRRHSILSSVDATGESDAPHKTRQAMKVAKTGSQPGITRKVGTLIKLSQEPLVYVYDTPGIFVPYLPDPSTMLKLSLVSSVKDGLIPLITVADYLLFQLNLYSPRGSAAYKKWSKPTNDVYRWLTNVATKTGKLLKGGEPDFDAAAQFVIARYRGGDFGKWGLDEVKVGGDKAWKDEVEGWGESVTKRRKAVRAGRKIKNGLGDGEAEGGSE